MVRGMRRQGEIRAQSCLYPEGQGVSGKNRFEWFAGCGGKGKYTVNLVHTPKGARFQAMFDFVCSFFAKKARA
jgi:hypothetical protein